MKRLLGRNRKELVREQDLLAFGVILTLLSSFGQTYFLGVSRPDFIAEFNLSDTAFGQLYLVVTLGSALGIGVFGHFIDRIPLQSYATTLGLLLGLAVIGVGLAPNLAVFFFFLLCVRLLGQGMMVHAAMTSIVRYFTHARGQAIAVVTSGLPLGQAVLPAVAVALSPVLGWRYAWIAFGLFILLVGVPLMRLLLRSHDKRHQRWLEQESTNTATTKHEDLLSSGRRMVLKDWRFYSVLPSMMALPFWITLILLYAGELATETGVSLQTLSGLYAFFAVGGLVCPFVAGALVDRFSARHMMLIYPFLTLTAMLLGQVAVGEWAVAVFLFFLGSAGGFSVPVNNALWAELYGTRNIGTVKSLSNSSMVVATSLAPAIAGPFFDAGVSFEQFLNVAVLHVLFATLCVVPVVLRP